MEQKRPKGRGLEEIAHLFFSSKSAAGGGQDRGVTAPHSTSGGETSAKILALISLAEDLPSPLFTTNLAVELSYRQKKVLVADTLPAAQWRAVNIFFAMGMERSFTPIEQFLTGETREVVTTGPLGIRILTFPLDPGRLALLRSIQPGGLFRSLIREECRNDILLVNMHRPSLLLSQSAPQIFSEALEILVLTPSDLQGLKATYGFAKSLFRLYQRSCIGILLYHAQTGGDADERFGLLVEAATKFLGRKLKGYGHLVYDPQLYLSLIRGRPLCRMPVRDSNTLVLAEIAKKISEQASREAPRPPEADRRLLMETLSRVSPGTLPHSSPSPLGGSLSREEEAFFDRQPVP